jgi:hypothetical protein
MSLSLTTGEKCDNYTTPKYVFEMLLPYIDTSMIIYDPFFYDGSSGEYLTELGYKNVIHNNEDFYINWCKYKFDIIITNPPYSSKVKVFQELYKVNKPFCVLVPVSTITKLFIKKIFGKDIDKLQLIIPNKRIHFLKNGNETKRCWFDTLFLCYKLNLENDISFI